LYDPKNHLSNARSPSTNDRQATAAHASPSPRPIPLTTNRLIGWRTADTSCTLEKYGKYARGQESLHKKFKWPVEGFN